MQSSAYDEILTNVHYGTQNCENIHVKCTFEATLASDFTNSSPSMIAKSIQILITYWKLYNNILRTSVVIHVPSGIHSVKWYTQHCITSGPGCSKPD